jgi:hypothetical protein
VEKYGRPRQATQNNIILRMRFACWITKATDTHSQYVILIAFPRQQWLRETLQYYVILTLPFSLYNSLNNTVGIVITLHAAQLTNRGCIPDRGKTVFPTAKCPHRFWSPPCLSSVGTWDHIHGGTVTEPSS